MKQYIVDYLNFVNERIAEYNNDAMILKADNREDEAVLSKVRVNICSIFSTMVGATDKKVNAMKQVNEEEKTRKFNEEYLNWFEIIPASWKTSLALALKHDDAIIVQTEEIKLETANLLKSRFLELSGGETLLQNQEV